MIEIVPVSVMCSEDGKRWFAKGLTYSALGRGGTAFDALNDLRNALTRILPSAAVELRIRSLSVTFPASLSEDDFLELDLIKDEAAKVG